MRDFINAQGIVPDVPRFLVEVHNNRFGRVLNIRDNFRHLDGGDLGSGVIFRQKLAANEKVMPILAANGYRLAGNWVTNRETTKAVIELV